MHDFDDDPWTIVVDHDEARSGADDTTWYKVSVVDQDGKPLGCATRRFGEFRLLKKGLSDRGLRVKALFPSRVVASLSSQLGKKLNDKRAAERLEALRAWVASAASQRSKMDTHASAALGAFCGVLGDGAALRTPTRQLVAAFAASADGTATTPGMSTTSGVSTPSGLSTPPRSARSSPTRDATPPRSAQSSPARDASPVPSDEARDVSPVRDDEPHDASPDCDDEFQDDDFDEPADANDSALDGSAGTAAVGTPIGQKTAKSTPRSTAAAAAVHEMVSHAKVALVAKLKRENAEKAHDVSALQQIKSQLEADKAALSLDVERVNQELDDERAAVKLWSRAREKRRAKIGGGLRGACGKRRGVARR
mmetsp:Transcript_29213/g.100854  ORF Transcript_29213/g.100854 Transcript_29213/m.100854 type:complete len:366 (-) Transcript_29213:171-1268(-)